ncbi:MAG: type VI secretion system baseplate subunit TssK [Desulfobacterales bacterium]|jgi:type VI secretion system protein ImpJ|nr:type VI secretion system baseplate subunit TssK [Desulfobacterales bacterium]
MNTALPLLWNQGLLLQPHHFQQQELFLQSLLAPFHGLSVPFFWGTASLEVREAALANRVFSLTRGQFLFPDQTHLTYPGNAVLESRSFEDAWPEGDQPLRVYLGLRRMNLSGNNVTVLPAFTGLQRVLTRFATLADAEPVADLHQESGPAQMQRLHYVLRVTWESEIDQLGEYVFCPVAQVERQGDRIELSRRYAPPSLTLAASPLLARLVQEIWDQLASRGSQLESYKRQRGIHTAEFGARDMVYLLALRSLNRYIPLLQHLLETAAVHPWSVYGLLRQLIGELSTFSETVTATGAAEDTPGLLAGYDHRNLYLCFSQAQALVSRLLDEITAGPEYVLPLAFDGTYFAAELQPAMFEGHHRFYLVCTSDAEAPQLVQSLTAIAKLSSRETLPILIARALPGIRLSHLALPPQELPRRARSVYFQIDHFSEHWARVQKGLNLALFWDSAPEDAQLELMIVGRS